MVKMVIAVRKDLAMGKAIINSGRRNGFESNTGLL